MRDHDRSSRHAFRLARWAAGITGTVLAGALVSSCTPGGGATPTLDSPVAPPPAASPVPPSPVDLAKQATVTAYVGMWQAMARAGETSDWRSPELARYATGEALSTLSRGLYADHYNGLVSRGRPIDHPVVSSVDPAADPTTVTISDCGDSTHWVTVRADNGNPVNDEPGGRRQINAIVKRPPDGGWKVTDFGVHEVGSC